mmetsp:Transcript_7257/g.10594  ORF Transcript_7257/g.10594 Transcript_7257/m.10594 type:complete len:129 (-) Transcript_7257:352-738(-)
MPNKLIRIKGKGVGRARTTAAAKTNKTQQDDNCSLSEAGTDTTLLIDNTTSARGGTTTTTTTNKCPSTTHILQVELSNGANVLPPDNDTSFEVELETVVVISHDSLDVDKETDESSDKDESAVEVICV